MAREGWRVILIPHSQSYWSRVLVSCQTLEPSILIAQGWIDPGNVGARLRSRPIAPPREPIAHYAPSAAVSREVMNPMALIMEMNWRNKIGV